MGPKSEKRGGFLNKYLVLSIAGLHMSILGKHEGGLAALKGLGLVGHPQEIEQFLTGQMIKYKGYYHEWW